MAKVILKNADAGDCQITFEKEYLDFPPLRQVHLLFLPLGAT